MKSKLLLYCTKSKPYLYHRIEQSPDAMNEVDCGYDLIYWKKEAKEEKELLSSFSLNGKIVAECDFEVDTIVMQKGADDKIYGNNGFMGYGIISKNHSFSWYDENKTCLSEEKLFNYLKGKNGYAIHIKNLHIFDEPRELSDYYKSNDYCKSWQPITKTPQNMMNAYDIDLGKGVYWKILISIRPEWLCKILNGEKIIELRKRVLKEMLR